MSYYYFFIENYDHCQISEYLCEDELKCFSLEKLCDDFEDCARGTDEKHCPKKKNPIIEEINNSNNNGKNESNVDKNKEPKNEKDNNQVIEKKCHPELSFTCGDNICIPIYQHCDGNYNCKDRSDEVGCSKKFIFDHIYLILDL